MVWFLVDDNLAIHKKADDAGNAALGLWVRAGAWSAGNLTDGFIPRRIAMRYGTVPQCESLCRSGLWSRVTDGYQFHDWHQCQPHADEVKQRREQARIRKARQRARGNPDDMSRVTPENVTPNVTRDSRATRAEIPYGDLSHRDRRRDQRARGATSAPGARTATPDRLTDIVDCAICDDEGLKPNGLPCDHIDRTETFRNGSAAVREILNEAKARKANG